jgi:hypothetical protein
MKEVRAFVFKIYLSHTPVYGRGDRIVFGYYYTTVYGSGENMKIKLTHLHSGVWV